MIRTRYMIGISFEAEVQLVFKHAIQHRYLDNAPILLPLNFNLSINGSWNMLN